MRSVMLLMCGLAVGGATLWAAALPMSTNSDAIVGGWTVGGGCCTTHNHENCSDGRYPDGTSLRCGGGGTIVCVVDPNGVTQCRALVTNECYPLPPEPPLPAGSELCSTTRDTTCGGG